MTEDPEKRLQRAMDKLYHAPKPRPSPSLQSGKRAEWVSRGNFVEKGGFRIPTAPATGTASMGSPGQVPPCRPWDRGDLMRRLATFKAMTWFAKPKAISPVNCARRGWVNAEMDVIVCEACGARLLFSTPSSWTIQQVEKAAAVFSLKLDNGHKLLCPWIDNACEEALALFPPTSHSDLVEAYNERASTLPKFSALPVVSCSAIDYMKKRSPLLESFLSQSSQLRINIKAGVTLVDASKNKGMDGAFGTDSSDLFYQAQKLISLCGWEPRVLPYVVDSEHQSTQRTENASESVPIQQSDCLTIYSSTHHVEKGATEHVDPSLDAYQYDPASVVLDCRFCGACVAFWAFRQVKCPLRLYHLVADFNNQNDPVISGEALATRGEAAGADDVGLGTYISKKVVGHTNYDGSAAKERSLSLNLTIAGGPPPTKQNFRPRVSFPIVSRHLRAELSFTKTTTMPFEHLSSNQVNAICLSQNNEPSAHENETLGHCMASKEPGSLKRKRSDSDIITAKSSHLNAEYHVEGETCSMSTSHSDNDLLEGSRLSEPGNKSVGKNDTEIQGDNSEKEKVVYYRSDVINTDVDKGRSRHEKIDGCKRVDIGQNTNTSSNVILGSKDLDSYEKGSEIGLPEMRSQYDDYTPIETSYGQTSRNLNDSFNTVSSSANNAGSCAQNLNSEKYENNSGVESSQIIDMSTNGSNGLKNMVSPTISDGDATHAIGSKSVQIHSSRTNEFDVIRHHRPYCPWIAPDDGETLPGWKLTLTAVVNQDKDHADATSYKAENSSIFLNEMDDPIVSVRKLFMSPTPKRLKNKH